MLSSLGQRALAGSDRRCGAPSDQVGQGETFQTQDQARDVAGLLAEASCLRSGDLEIVGFARQPREVRQEGKGPGQRVQVASTARQANGLVSVDASLCQRSRAGQYRGPDLKRPGVWAVAHENRAQLEIALADS